MAKISISADTLTGEMECHIDGKAIESVVGCNLYVSERWDESQGKYVPSCGMDMRMKPVKENGVTYHMSAYASNHDKAVAAINKRTAEFISEDVVLIKENTLQNDIMNALRK